MATQDDVRRIALSLPGVEESVERFGFSVAKKGKSRGFCYSWNERVDPKKAKVPNPDVLVVVVRSLTEKEILLGSDPNVFFTEPHYNGYAAVLVRIEAIAVDDLEDIVTEAWKCTADPDVVAKWESALG